MLWGGFNASNLLPLQFVTSRMKSDDYQKTLEASLMPFLDENRHCKYTYQQDNASIHVSKSSRDWFKARNVDLLDWPALSPDLNPMENLWAYIVQEVYGSGTQYDTVEELKRAILHCWTKIEPDLCKNLVDSMPDRIADVLENQGNKINY